MVPGRPAPSISTGVPTGSEPLVQPSVSVEPPVPEQCAACPRYTSDPCVYTKFEVHWAPSVKVITPGCTGAVAAGAHADAAAGASATIAIATNTTPTMESRFLMISFLTPAPR